METGYSRPVVEFASPRALPNAGRLGGRVVVLDIAFAATSGGKVCFENVTQPFIEGLGSRLAAWVDHHDHERHGDFSQDSRFVLATKAQHGACPEMITPELVRHVGPVDTIVAHSDLDGLFAAAKWILGGHEPYRGADADARCVDTRTGEPSEIASRVDRALRARFRDVALKHAILCWLVDGLPSGTREREIRTAARDFEIRLEGSRTLARAYVTRGRVAYVDASQSSIRYDKTELLLLGQQRHPIAVVRDAGAVTIAADFDSGWDFLQLLGLEGGMPTRVTVPESRLDEALSAINGAPVPKLRNAPHD